MSVSTNTPDTGPEIVRPDKKSSVGPKPPAPKRAPKREPLAEKLLGGTHPERAMPEYTREATRWEKINLTRSENGVVGFDGLILEDAYTAFSLKTKEAQLAHLHNLLGNVEDAIAALQGGGAK